jgi:hypothetical protein
MGERGAGISVHSHGDLFDVVSDAEEPGLDIDFVFAT